MTQTHSHEIPNYTVESKNRKERKKGKKESLLIGLPCIRIQLFTSSKLIFFQTIFGQSARKMKAYLFFSLMVLHLLRVLHYFYLIPFLFKTLHSQQPHHPLTSSRRHFLHILYPHYDLTSHSPFLNLLSITL